MKWREVVLSSKDAHDVVERDEPERVTGSCAGDLISVKATREAAEPSQAGTRALGPVCEPRAGWVPSGGGLAHLRFTCIFLLMLLVLGSLHSRCRLKAIIKEET